MRGKCIALIAVASLALLASGPANASIFKKSGKDLKSVTHFAMNGVRDVHKGEGAAMKFAEKEGHSAMRFASLIAASG